MNTHEQQKQQELYERTRKRIQQKKKVYYHFILFLVGSAFLIVVNKFYKIGDQLGDWYQWAVTIWFFLWLLQLINVFITNRFFGKEWERAETEKLIAKHQEKIKKLEQKLIINNTIASSEDDILTR
ncbi:MAG: 2TM domain-containing protein [Flavobacteriaceae bacterium]|nr:2TM domain-containing protein [Flavobacteriaceae bacterium]